MINIQREENINVVGRLSKQNVMLFFLKTGLKVLCKISKASGDDEIYQDQVIILCSFKCAPIISVDIERPLGHRVYTMVEGRLEITPRHTIADGRKRGRGGVS